ncbi:MAG: DNA-3-methyladenine glycosylase 2 family protein [Chloroflexi bacterium]|nr:DNA-3-methyladenine glycosylase 2 family protein [Chloroflexota bacterium]
MATITTITTTVYPVAPFDFELTAGYLTYFQGRYGTDSLTDGVYRRLLDLDGTLVLASVRSVGTIESPELAVELRGEGLTSSQVGQASERVAWLLGAQQDLAPFYSMAEKDSTMLAMTQRFHGLHLPHTASVFEALVLAILGQQIATNVARIIRTLLIETYGPSQTFDGDVYYSFPRPETLGAVPVEELRGKKLSQRKAEYVQGIALAALDDPTGLEGLHQLTDQEVVQSVTALRGVGNWTAQWLLIRALGREDALPLGDLALRRAVSRFYFGDVQLDDKQVEEFSRRWSPFRTYATVYMFTAMRTGMG